MLVSGVRSSWAALAAKPREASRAASVAATDVWSRASMALRLSANASTSTGPVPAGTRIARSWVDATFQAAMRSRPRGRRARPVSAQPRAAVRPSPRPASSTTRRRTASTVASVGPRGRATCMRRLAGTSRAGSAVSRRVNVRQLA